MMGLRAGYRPMTRYSDAELLEALEVFGSATGAAAYFNENPSTFHQLLKVHNIRRVRRNGVSVYEKIFVPLGNHMLMKMFMERYLNQYRDKRVEVWIGYCKRWEKILGISNGYNFTNCTIGNGMIVKVKDTNMVIVVKKRN